MWERALTSAPCRINNPIIATFRAATGLPPSVQITSGLRISQQAACINDVQPQLSRASISAPQPVSVLRASSRGPYSVAVRSSVSPKSFWADTSAPQFSGGAMIVGLSVRGPIPVSEPDASQTIGSRFSGVVHVMTPVRTTTGINKAEDAGGWMPKSGSPMRCSGSCRRWWSDISNFVAGSANGLRTNACR